MVRSCNRDDGGWREAVGETKGTRTCRLGP